MFTALSYNWGNLNEKVNIFMAAAPITKLENSLDSFLRDISTFGEGFIQGSLWLMNVNELMGGKNWDNV